MQIDTHNRNHHLTDADGYRPWHLPARSTANASVTDLRGGLSPLIECPCTDRIRREARRTPKLVASGTCAPATIRSAAKCFASAGDVAKLESTSVVSDANLAPGCLIHAGKMTGGARATYNTNSRSTVACGGASSAHRGLIGSTGPIGDLGAGPPVTMTIDHDGHIATITLSGPAGVWFGVGFDAEQMADAPYAIIVDGAGRPTERRLATHDPGRKLTPSITHVSSDVSDGVRVVVVTRRLDTTTPEHYIIPKAPAVIPLIAAVGSGAQLAYHRAHTATAIGLLPKAAAACVCEPAMTGYLVYNNMCTYHTSSFISSSPAIHSDLRRPRAGLMSGS